MGASITSSGTVGLFENPEIFMVLLRARLYTAMETVILEAVENMKHFTEANRNEISGDMLRAIGGKTFFVGVNRIVGEFGFEDNQQLYYVLQSGNQPAGGITGFKHFPDGKFIESDFAMRDAYIIAIEHLIEQLNRPIL